MKTGSQRDLSETGDATSCADPPSGQGFSFRQVQAFLTLANHGSFTKAAGAIHLSQSGLSRLIASLEREIGEPLFVRASNALRLSSAGKAFYPFASRLAECYANTLNLRLTSGPPKTSIACSCMVVSELMSLLSESTLEEGKLQLWVKSMTSHKVQEAVRCEEADLGVCMVGVAPKDLRVENIFNAPLGLLASPDFPLPCSIERWEVLQGLTYARLEDKMVLPSMLRHSGVDLPGYFGGNLISDNMPSLIGAVASGPCVTLVSEVAAQHVLARKLVFKPLPDLLPRLRLCIVSRRSDDSSATKHWVRCVAHGLLRRYGGSPIQQ